MTPSLLLPALRDLLFGFRALDAAFVMCIEASGCIACENKSINGVFRKHRSPTSMAMTAS